MDSIFALVLGGLWLWVVYSGLKHVVGKAGRLFGFRSAESRATWSDAEYRQYNQAPPTVSEPEGLDDLTEDMEQAVADAREMASDLRRELRDQQAVLDRLEKVAADWADRAALAMSKGRSELARAAIVERIQTQEHSAELTKKMAESRELLAGYDADIERLQRKLAEAYRRQHRALARLERAEHSQRAQQLLGSDNSDVVAQELARLERLADEAEGRAGAAALGEGSLPDPFAALEEDDRVERELRRLTEQDEVRKAS